MNIYNVGIYVRLSREDDEKNFKESESIKNQKEFLVSYCLERGWNVKEIYVDDGFMVPRVISVPLLYTI